MSNSVAKALQLANKEELEETINFVPKFDKWFDCLNVSSLSAGRLTRNPFKSPYRSATDFRLKVLIHVTISFLNIQNSGLKKSSFHSLIPGKSVNKREGFTKADKMKMLLSSETLLGIRMTGIHV